MKTSYLATPAINYWCYGKRRAPLSSSRSCQLLCKFVFLILFFTEMYIILFCNLVCVYLHKICEDKFGGCQKTFSWLGQKANKKIDAYGHDAYAASRQDTSTWFRILIEFEATEYLYSILYFICIQNFEDIWFKWKSGFIPSLELRWTGKVLHW